MGKEDYSWYSVESTKPLTELKDLNISEKYRANNKGDIFIHDLDTDMKDNKFYGKKMNPYINRDGYVEYVVNDNDGNKKHLLSHRVVALLFIPNPKNLPHVNHKDTNKENCKESNLEWSTVSDNNKKAYKAGKVPWNKGKCLKCKS